MNSGFINQKKGQRFRRRAEIFTFSILALASFVFISTLPSTIPQIVQDIKIASNRDETILGAVGENKVIPVSPKSDLDFGTAAEGEDVRAYVLDEYFLANQSPMYGTGEIFARMCHKYDVPQDCLTVAAIARAETDLCKYSNSASYFNCWGFGGGGIYRIYFNSWEEGIDRVFDSLANSYGYKFMVDPRLMEDTFCGDEPGCTNWGNRVIHFMDEIDEFAQNLGIRGGMYSFRDKKRTE